MTIPKSRYNYIFATLHVLVWGALMTLPYFFLPDHINNKSDYQNPDYLPKLYLTTSSFLHIGIFYLNAYYLMPKFLNRRRWVLYILLSAGLVTSSILVKQVLLNIFWPYIPQTAAVHGYIIAPSIFIFIISIFYRLVIDRVRLESEQKKIRAERVETELKFLRSQINPHFLFNVLTNLVSLARKKSDQLEPALITLSNLMRYMIYDSTGKKVQLGKEIEYLSGYIQLQTLRFGNDVKIDYDIGVTPQAERSMIEPMLLIPFVENAFKHGVGFIHDANIRISLSVDDEVLTFVVVNKFNSGQPESKDEDSGIGLANVKSRLAILYKGNYSLDIAGKDDLYRVTLMLKLI